jgi:hypothetical protein
MQSKADPEKKAIQERVKKGDLSFEMLDRMKDILSAEGRVDEFYMSLGRLFTPESMTPQDEVVSSWLLKENRGEAFLIIHWDYLGEFKELNSRSYKAYLKKSIHILEVSRTPVFMLAEDLDFFRTIEKANKLKITAGDCHRFSPGRGSLIRA